MSSKSRAKQAIDPATPAGARPSASKSGKATWKVLDRGSSIAAALLAREASQLLWRVVVGRRPPTNGRHPEVDTREAIAWAIVGGALVELVKVGVRRYASLYWVRSTGHLPPGMKPRKP